jgi:HEAT repeat protein
MDLISTKQMRNVIICILFVGSPILHSEDIPQRKERDMAFFEEQRRRIDSSDPEEIRDAIDRLSFVRSRQGVGIILLALRGTPNFPTSTQNSPVVKFYAAKALGKKGELAAVAPLIYEFKERSQGLNERQKTKRKIQDNVNGRDSLSSPYFFNSDDISLVLACGEMLRALGSLPLTEDSGKLIKQSLTHKNFYIRASAADAIFLSGRIQLASGLSELISTEKDDYSKISFVSALAGLERLPNQNFKTLTMELNNEDPEIRKKASEGLSRMGLRLGATYLEKAISLEGNERVLAQMKEDYRVLTSFQVPSF